MFELVLVSLFVVSFSQPVGEYHSPLPTDHRSPCPGFNALANHGYLPRNGRNITLKQFKMSVIKIYRLSNDVVDLALVGAGILKFPNGVMKSLHDLTFSHNVIEHDASLTRNDQFFGDPSILNITLLDQLIVNTSGMVHISTIAEQRKRRVLDSQNRNPQFTWNRQTQQNDSAFESAFISTIFGDWNNHVEGQKPSLDAPALFVYEWLRYERLPNYLGWKPRNTEITVAEFSPVWFNYLDLELTTFRIEHSKNTK